jgi:oxygen-independent coproporphyrinogen-3 oxidase
MWQFQMDLKLPTARLSVLGLYVHVPFCSSICSYCNFNRGLLDEPLKRRYVGALEREIREAGDGRAADTVFFGGGTPSLLEPSEIARLLQAARESYALTADAEITLETNPETVTPDRLEKFRAAGVNRISFGVQSFDDGELQRLGRVHSAAKAEEAVRAARQAGFDNLSFDLMLWLPGQTPESWRRTVERAIELDPDHLSMYLLELYPNAPLKEAMARQQTDEWQATSDDVAADMYLDALGRTDAAGFVQYEISNVARPGFASRHNLKYWQGGSWRGFGCGAHSTVDGRRWRTVSGTSEYVDRIVQGEPVTLDDHVLSAREREEEALFTGLRLTQGIERRRFAATFAEDPWLRYAEELRPHVEDGFMWEREGAFGLTRRGMLVANEILLTFV